jgi:hypothetical protein
MSRQKVIIEYQDLRVQVPTGDAQVATYTEKTVRTIDPDGNRVDYTGADVGVDSSTYLAANLNRATFKRGRWRFSASAVDGAGKLRKTPWYWLYVNGEGEV